MPASKIAQSMFVSKEQIISSVLKNYHRLFRDSCKTHFCKKKKKFLMLQQFAHVFITELGTVNKLEISGEF